MAKKRPMVMETPHLTFVRVGKSEKTGKPKDSKLFWFSELKLTILAENPNLVVTPFWSYNVLATMMLTVAEKLIEIHWTGSNETEKAKLVDECYS